jgi:AcrR family transcriptional regulator
MTSPPSTRDRIIREATRLFASQGIRATTVAQIEQAVGLRAGSGGVHRHFATKDVLIRAVLDAQLEHGQRAVTMATQWPKPEPDDVPAYLDAIARFALEHIDESREIALIMLREAHNLPPGVLDDHHRRNFELSYASTATALRGLLDSAGTSASIDTDALGYLFMAPLIYFRVIEWATGERVLGIDDERLIAAWTTLFTPVFTSTAGRATTRRPRSRAKR